METSTGGSGGSGGGVTGFDGSSSTPPPAEEYPDTVPVPTPDCSEVTPSSPPYQKAWCYGQPVSGTRHNRVQSAISAIMALDGPCLGLAVRAQALLNTGDIRSFARADANTGGVGFEDGLAILDSWIDLYHEEPFELDGYRENLRFVIAHESWHSLHGPGHSFVDGWYAETPNAKFCSGLGL